MQFTYQAYQELLTLLKEKGYGFTDYHHYQEYPRCVILRHDIDNSLAQAVELAKVEHHNGIHSTWFVLLRTDFYNPASRKCQEQLRTIQNMGHEIGLHFDETAYGRELSPEEMYERVTEECKYLSMLLGREVTAVSMHRPSAATLEADLQFSGIVNSYGKTFFHEFKYLSDSRRRWREPILKIIRSGEYDRLHILTHAFWYHEQEESITDTVRAFVRNANQERYVQMTENITDIQSILREDDV